jgi:hypothetical protein
MQYFEKRKANLKLSTRELVTIAVFGTLWGIVEITLGGILKSLNVPLSGLILFSIGITIAMIGRLFVPKRGSILFIGIIAMILKIFSLGGIIIGPMLGIIMEALIVEFVLSTKSEPSQPLLMFAGVFGSFWVLIQPFISGPLILGRSFLVVWLGMVDLTRNIFNLGEGSIFMVIGLFVLIHILIGLLTGIVAWKIGKQVKIRLKKQTANTFQF